MQADKAEVVRQIGEDVLGKVVSLDVVGGVQLFGAEMASLSNFLHLQPSIKLCLKSHFEWDTK